MELYFSPVAPINRKGIPDSGSFQDVYYVEFRMKRSGKLSKMEQSLQNLYLTSTITVRNSQTFGQKYISVKK